MTNFNMSPFEILGKKILEELQLLREDMKTEVSRIGFEMKEFCSLHKTILSELNHKLENNTNLERQSNINDSKIINKVSESLVFVNKFGESVNETCVNSSNEYCNKKSSSDQKEVTSCKPTDLCFNNNSNILKHKSITIKEEVPFIEHYKALKHFEIPIDIPDCRKRSSVRSNCSKQESYLDQKQVTSCNATDLYFNDSSNILKGNHFIVKEELPFMEDDKALENFEISVDIPDLHKKSNLKSIFSNKNHDQSVTSYLKRKPLHVRNDVDTSIFIKPANTSLNFSLSKVTDSLTVPHLSNSSSSVSVTDSATVFDRPENFRCQFCQKPFQHFSSYQSHVRSHTGEKPFKCDLCNKHFTQKGNLRKHVILHQNKRPFVCNICDKRFTQKGNLKSHVLRHSKYHKCNVCDKSFKKMDHFLAHKQIHDM